MSTPKVPNGEKPSSGIDVPGETKVVDGDAKPQTPVKVPPMRAVDQPGGKSPGSDYQP